MGVKVILFAKFTWADRGTEWFRSDLIRLAIKDPYGDYQMHPGYQYQTATQLLDINTKRLIPMCFLSEEYLRAVRRGVPEDGRAGRGRHPLRRMPAPRPGPAVLRPAHGHRYGAPVYANDRQADPSFRRMSDAVRPDFLFAGEALLRLGAGGIPPVLSPQRKQGPHSALPLHAARTRLLMTAVTGFDDRNMINQCLMYRYIISYEPYNFKGRLDDYPATLAYGRKMDALRTELRDYFWDGEFRDEVGAAVSVDGAAHRPYAVFTSRSTGRTGLVICNYNAHTNVTVRARLANGSGPDRYRLVDEPSWHRCADGIVIPPQSAAVAI